MWASVGGLGKQCTQPSAYYFSDLESCKSIRRIQVAKPELSLNPVGSLCQAETWRVCLFDWPGAIVKGGGKHHAQK